MRCRLKKDDTSDRKRSRQGSDAVSPPPALMRQMRGYLMISKHKGPPRVPKPSSSRVNESAPQAHSGSKRQSDGNEAERDEMIREDEAPHPVGQAILSSCYWDREEDVVVNARDVGARSRT